MREFDSIDKSSSPTLVLRARDDGERILIKKCKLLAVSGPFQGQEFVMERDYFSIGNDPHSELVIEDSTISRRHCEIQFTEDGYVIRDLESTNGTFVQGIKIKEAFLDEGTEFQLGKTRLVFCPMQESLEWTLSKNDSFGTLLGRSNAIRRVFHLAETYAPTDASILIEGETGTGKEVLAEEIHKHSLRSKKPFIVIDCAALAKDLIQSELFGHTKGAFTGANSERVGAFEHANGGTVFLDEIGELAPELQPKLLRVLEKRQIKRVGSNDVREIDVRIICATNRRLETEVNNGNFREDLYYRLSVVRMELPPLRRRKEDIELLAKKFLVDLHGMEVLERIIDWEDTVEAFGQHDWPGNVRELRNLMELASFKKEGPIDLSTFLYMGRAKSTEDKPNLNVSADRPFKDAKNDLISQFERQYIKELLSKNDGNISQAARNAGIERAYLQRLIKKHE
ncbi:hypothetical protein BVX97_00115 [bacterium E08(2017)]|nr:hypothetical protein BVX97_00115 [bacterium E08(2017)]